MNVRPPKWAVMFLKWYCDPYLLEEIEGDIYELFDRHVKQSGASFARFKFVWHVLRFCRLANFREDLIFINRTNNIYMFKNYVKIGLRNMRRYWVTSSVNIIGLALAMGCLITLSIFIEMQQNMDKYHLRVDDIYQVANQIRTDDEIELWGDSPYALGPALLAEHSGVEDMFRIEFQAANVKYDNKVFGESVVFTDPGFLKMLDHDFLAGSEKVLYEFDQITISYNMAEKYFALQDPMGKLLTLKFENGLVKTFTVGAVMNKYPYNSSFNYDFILSMQALEKLNLVDKLDWSYLTDATFVLLRPETDPGTIKLDEYIDTQNSFDPEWPVANYEMYSLADLVQKGNSIQSSVTRNSSLEGQIALGVIAVLLTLLACFNYMNISVASSTKRLKEIALRKVMGSNREAIAWQFLVENLLQVMFALLFGTLLAYFIFMPGFNAMVSISIPFRFTSIPEMFGFFFVVLVVVGVLSSLYPSIYISKFQPTSIFKGNTSLGSRNIFSKVLLTFQLLFAFTTVVACFIFTENAVNQKNQSLGYDDEGIITVELFDPTQFEAMQKTAIENPNVAKFAGAQNQMCLDYDIQVVSQQEIQTKSVVFNVSPEYVDLVKFNVIAGRDINARLHGQSNKEVLVNQQFVKKMDWNDPIGESITIDDTTYEVVGVLEDFKYQMWFAYEETLPVILKIVPKSQYQYAIFKSKSGQLDALDSDLKSLWLEIAPNDPYERVIQANAYDSFYAEVNGNITIIGFISGLAIILASLGLFGLFSFNIQSRIKEFSIRKILGAKMGSIIHVASKQYFWIVAIAFVIGAPTGFFLMSAMVQKIYPVPKPIGIWSFVLAIVIMVVTLSVTVVGQLYKAANVNPADNLRNE